MKGSIPCAAASGLLLWVTAECAAQDPRQSGEPLATLVANLGSTDANLRRTAIKALEPPIVLFGPVDRTEFRREAKPLLPDLVSLLGHSDQAVVSTAINLIERMGTDAHSSAEELRRLVVDEHQPSATRLDAARAMFFVTPETIPVTPLILPQPDSVPNIAGERNASEGTGTGERFPNVRSTIIAMWAYGVAEALLLSGHTKIEIPHLLKATSKSYPPNIRALTAVTLAVLGPEARAATPALRLLLRDDDELVRRAAASAILAIEMDPRQVTELADCLRLEGDDREEFEKNAREHLEWEREDHMENVAAAVEDPGDYVPILVHVLKFGRGPERRAAIRILRDVGPSAKRAVSELKNALTDHDMETRQLAISALRRIDPSILRSPKSQQAPCGANSQVESPQATPTSRWMPNPGVAAHATIRRNGW